MKYGQRDETYWRPFDSRYRGDSDEGDKHGGWQQQDQQSQREENKPWRTSSYRGARQRRFGMSSVSSPDWTMEGFYPSRGRNNSSRGSVADRFDSSGAYSPEESREGHEEERNFDRGTVFGQRYRGQYYGRAPKNYSRSDDRIKEDVADRFMMIGAFDPSEVIIRVENGIVILEGSVDDRTAKRQAEDIAEDVIGVEDVENRLKLRKGLWSRMKEVVTGQDQESEDNLEERSTSSSS